VKYVFVHFQENCPFDHYFGTYPGANELLSQSPSVTLGFVQKLVNTDETVGTRVPLFMAVSTIS
jgi:phospholipase C